MVEISCSFPPFVAMEALEGEGDGAARLRGSGGSSVAGSGGVRWERIALIRARLASGSYGVSAAAVAEAMLRGTESSRSEAAADVECELAMQ
ncbi:MAG TPA: flagellar biosynthesis anti-sigma factor FlgM [Acidobacteriaceae bacterium]